MPLDKSNRKIRFVLFILKSFNEKNFSGLKDSDAQHANHPKIKKILI
jgi:hypothetical protein